MKKKEKKKLKELKEKNRELEVVQKADSAANDQEDVGKRLNRIVGQIEGIRKMMNDGRTLDDILIQCKAVHSALRSVESRMLKNHLDQALNELAKTEKKKNREQKIAELVELYRPAA